MDTINKMIAKVRQELRENSDIETKNSGQNFFISERKYEKYKIQCQS